MRRRKPSDTHNCSEPWLIKSSSRLLGPFSTEEVIDKLKTREIVALDELIGPQGRWRYVTDEPVFTEIAKKMRNNEMDERTMTATIESSSDDFTDTVDISTLDALKKGGAWEDGAEEQETQEKVKSYGFQQDKNIEKEALVRSKWMWPVGIVVVLAAIGLALFLEMGPEDKRNPSYLVRKGKLALEFGENKKAIDYFIRALKKDQQNTEAILALAPLMAQDEKDFVLARRLLGQLAPTETQSEEVFALHGLIDLLDNKFEEAEKWIDKSLALNSRFVPALVNKMAVLYFKKDDKGLERVYERIQKVEPFEGASTMLAILSNINSYKTSGNSSHVQRATELIRSYLGKRKDYRQEMLLAQNYIDFVLSRRGNPRTLVAALDMDPYLTDLHFHDPMIYRSHLDWANLMPWCVDIFRSAPKLVRAEALYAMCLIKTRQTVEAGKVLGHSLKKDPNDLLLSAMQAYYLIETENEDKGLRLLRHISKRQPHDLALFLIGHNCTTEEGDCSLGAWDLLLQRDQSYLAAVHGVAASSLESDETERTREFLNRGSRISPSYYPLKKVRWQLEHGAEVE